MLWELLATVFAGLGAAGIALALRAFTRRRLPAWIIPVCAGGAMLGLQIYSEYAWFSHQKSLLPTDVLVARQVKESAPWRPWTYLYPQTVRFIAVKVGEGAVNRVNSELVLADVFLFERRMAARQVPQIFHCGANARANLTDDLDIPEPGASLGNQWTTLEPTDELLLMVCGKTLGGKRSNEAHQHGRKEHAQGNAAMGQMQDHNRLGNAKKAALH